MNKKDMLTALQMDIEIPEIVQEKANEAFAKLQQNDKKAAPQTVTASDQRREAPEGKRRRKMTRKKMIIMIAAAVFACASITVAAASIRWSRSLSKGLQISEEQKLELEQDNAMVFVEQACTSQGITVSAVQTITDNYFTHIVFRVEGYQLEEGIQPDFGMTQVTVDGRSDFNMGASFYDGMVMGADGRFEYDDGTPVDWEAQEYPERYAQEDGSMEYCITLQSDTKGYFIGKDIHVELRGLGSVAKAEYFHDIDGEWIFDWNLQGTEDMKEYTLQEALGDTGATVVRAEISPVSMHVEYEFPKQQVTETGLNEKGEPIQANFFVEPPMLSGVQMKDGTLYPYLTNGGSYGYESEDKEIYFSTTVNSRIIDVSQVESLLFLKAVPEENRALTEEDFYIVPLD